MKKPTNTGAGLKTRTASWQYDSMDYADGMDNDDTTSYKALTKYQGNQSGLSEKQDMKQYRVGNTGKTANTGPKKPPTSSVPAFERAMKSSDSINGGPQVRTPGGTREFAPSAGQNYRGNPDRINEGRGPTKGNAQ